MRRGDALTLSKLSLGAHSGTHIDAPMHFIRDGIPIDQVITRASDRPRARDRHSGQRAGDRRGRARSPRLEGRGARDLPHAKLGSRLDEVADVPSRLRVHRTRRGARLLADAGVKLVGIDYLSSEQFGAPAPLTHRALLGAGIPIVEGLDLTNVSAGDYDLIVLPIKIAGHEGAPARAVMRKRVP